MIPKITNQWKIPIRCEYPKCIPIEIRCQSTCQLFWRVLVWVCMSVWNVFCSRNEPKQISSCQLMKIVISIPLEYTITPMRRSETTALCNEMSVVNKNTHKFRQNRKHTSLHTVFQEKKEKKKWLSVVGSRRASHRQNRKVFFCCGKGNICAKNVKVSKNWKTKIFATKKKKKKKLPIVELSSIHINDDLIWIAWFFLSSEIIKEGKKHTWNLSRTSWLLFVGGDWKSIECLCWWCDWECVHVICGWLVAVGVHTTYVILNVLHRKNVISAQVCAESSNSNNNNKNSSNSGSNRKKLRFLFFCR